MKKIIKQKTNKSKIQTIVVSFANLIDFEKEIKINTDDVCDDIYLEACTRAVELNIKDKKLVIVPFIEARLKNEPDKKKFKLYNSYKVLINAAYHRYAKNLRDEFKKTNNIDLNDEPICANLVIINDKEIEIICKKKPKTR